ncbi:His/Gly/Thr/Pro-type tRNA ligase C-terminal domain-containing protein [Salarchaeum sp. III]|uniref:His/Gly/Thr/Pro-type tRNA ligase C-terminal domain-containing protein n=1 Tax=Salarchaeum sp. III TaxID=3107927 RepID=UPI002EDB429F
MEEMSRRVVLPDGDWVAEVDEDPTSTVLSPPESAGTEPPHLSLMRKKGFVSYDEFGDTGAMRWHPRGMVVKDLLERYASSIANALETHRVETPTMYDAARPEISEQVSSFDERQYTTSGRDPLYLRFASDFGHFSTLRTLNLTEQQLPVRLYELAHGVFRQERSGETTALTRQREFTLPDIHTAVANESMGRTEFVRQAALALETEDAFDLEYALKLSMNAQDLEERREWVAELAGTLEKPIVLDIRPTAERYWTVKLDYLFVDGYGNTTELATVELDSETVSRFDITYERDSRSTHPVLVHCSPTGSIERAFAAMLDRAAERRNPQFPVWLSPTQVRLIPVGAAHDAYCADIAKRLESRSVRVDIDDRDRTVGKRVAKAEQDWVPYYIVVGDDEVKESSLQVTRRPEGIERSMALGELESVIDDATSGFPDATLCHARRLSERTRFDSL